jgi:phosphatidylglycerol:prolipoprotein diacylglycerol transferase
MWPEIVHIGPITVYSFGLMAALAFLSTGYLLEKQLDRAGYNKEMAGPIVIAALVGGILGSKIYFFIQHPEYLQVWYGGLIGGFLVVSGYVRYKKLNYLLMADLIAPLLLLGQGIGRIGCFLSGDGDYGPPSDVPWAMAFPNGVVPTDVPVHPTPLYDMLLLFTLFAILWKLRKKKFVPGTHGALFLAFIGTERFITEFWRREPKYVFDAISEAQLISLIALFLGIGILIWLYRKKIGEVHSGNEKER